MGAFFDGCSGLLAWYCSLTLATQEAHGEVKKVLSTGLEAVAAEVKMDFTLPVPQ